MKSRRITYPFTPKSTASLIPGQFWALPLSNGSFGCGRVIQLLPAGAPGSRVLFLAALLDWVSSELPRSESIAGVGCVDQGQVHIKAITETGGAILEQRPLDLDGIAPWLFRGAHGWQNSVVQEGLIPVRPQTPADRELPVLSTWGYEVARVIAEARFVEKRGPWAEKRVQGTSQSERS